MKSKFKELSDNLLYEMALPKGFTFYDVLSLDDFIDEEEEKGQEISVKVKGEPVTAVERVMDNFIREELDDANISDIDIEDLIQKRLSGKSAGDIAARPERMLHPNHIIDENGNVLDSKRLMKQIMVRPKKIIDQNTKLKTSGSRTGQIFYDSTLPSYQGLFVDEDTNQFKVVRTCPSAGECSKFCYAAKGGYVMFPNSGMNATRTVNFLMNDPEGFKTQMIEEINAAAKKAAKQNKTIVLRWHDSGDFLSEKYLQMAFDVARSTPDVLHYAYTKQVPLVKKLEQFKPENFVFNFSFGGEHDEVIDPLVDKHAQVVPRNIFKDLPVNKTATGLEFPETSLKALKQRVAKEFGINPNSILSYNELIETEPVKGKKYNVLVWKGHGDDAATRKDVLGTYLLFH